MQWTNLSVASLQTEHWDLLIVLLQGFVGNLGCCDNCWQSNLELQAVERAKKAILQAKGGCYAKTQVNVTMSAQLHLSPATWWIGPCSTVHRCHFGPCLTMLDLSYKGVRLISAVTLQMTHILC